MRRLEGTPCVGSYRGSCRVGMLKNGLLDGTYNVDDAEAEQWFTRWREGRTGFSVD